MEGVNVQDVGTLAGLRGIGGYGYGNFQGDGSAVNANVVANRDLGVVGAINSANADQFLSDRITDGDRALTTTIASGNQFLTDRINSQHIDSHFDNVSRELASAERLAFANQAAMLAIITANKADTDRQLHSMELKQVECCCELKAGQATIIAKLDSDRAAAAETEVNNLRIQLQINQQGGRGNQNGGGGGNG